MKYYSVLILLLLVVLHITGCSSEENPKKLRSADNVKINSITSKDREKLKKQVHRETLTECKFKSVPEGRIMKRKLVCSQKVIVGNSKGMRADNFNTETYDNIEENNLKFVKDEPLSTFSIDVDTASYSNIRRMLNRGELPPKGAVRIEEMVNYFNYNYPKVINENQPFATNVTIGSCPWNDKSKLVRIAIKGKEIPAESRPKANLVFLLDVSGSMRSPNKLPLLRNALKMLVNNLNDQDRVAIVVYAGASGLVLESTACNEKTKIMDALNRLSAGGSTNGAAGITQAYKVAVANFIEGGINRVILCTDGDFNVGTTNQSDLINLIQKSAKSDVFLTVLGFGMGNYKDSTLEKLADKGNGNYGYIDDEKEARKLLVKQIGGTLNTIAKDVKIQVEFNPSQVQAYRLIGYENRKLNNEDFANDEKDAGEIGAGHTITAFYEVFDNKTKLNAPETPQTKYSKNVASDIAQNEILEVKIRYKEPNGTKSKLLKFPLTGKIYDAITSIDNDFKFANAVIIFGMLLRHSKNIGSVNYNTVLKLAQNSVDDCKNKNYERSEFINLVKKAQRLTALK
ncbi:VWA domain-containing protein [Lentisphaerota bacterium WC36G]|nr:VWA domain-containing protein [Lentisphaerae bacterium WC36]